MKKKRIETSKAIFNIIDNVGDITLEMGRKYIDLSSITEEKASELAISVDHLDSVIRENNINLYSNPIPIPQMQGEWQGDEFIPLGYDMNHVAEYENAEANTFYNPILEIIEIK